MKRKDTNPSAGTTKKMHKEEMSKESEVAKEKRAAGTKVRWQTIELHDCMEGVRTSTEVSLSWSDDEDGERISSSEDKLQECALEDGHEQDLRWSSTKMQDELDQAHSDFVQELEERVQFNNDADAMKVMTDSIPTDNSEVAGSSSAGRSTSAQILEELMQEKVDVARRQSIKKAKCASERLRSAYATMVTELGQEKDQLLPQQVKQLKPGLCSIYPNMEAADVAIRAWAAKGCTMCVHPPGSKTSRVYVCSSHISAFPRSASQKLGKGGKRDMKDTSYWRGGLEREETGGTCAALVQVQRVTVKSLMMATYRKCVIHNSTSYTLFELHEKLIT